MTEGRDGGEAAKVETAGGLSAAAEPFFRALERLEGVVDEETRALQRNDLSRIGDFNRAKNVGLLELSRALALVRGRAQFDDEARPALARLREALARNLSAADTLLQAVRQVAAIIARAIDEHESDGTYAAPRARKGAAG